MRRSGRSSSRLRPWAFACACAAAFAVRTGAVAAQDWSAGEEEIIADPELAEIAPPPEPAPEIAVEPNGRVRVVLRSRVGVDLQWQDPREDVWEATQLALFEARVRRSERVSFEVGLRARHVYFAREGATADAVAHRAQLDIAPTAGFADLKLADPLHLRLGYQSVLLGRFDVLSRSDVLSARDLRSGPTTLPEASEIAQPALRLDWDASPWLSLKLVALPFFQPHVVHAFEGDYALSPARQAELDAGFADFSPQDAARQRALVRGTLSRSGQAQIAETTVSAFAPEPVLESPQAALRAVARGGAGELGLTVATARERLPALYFSDAFLCALRACSADATERLLADTRPIAIEYGRFALAALDGMLVLGPVQLGLELTYEYGRTLFAVPGPGLPSLPAESDLATAGLRFEYLAGAEFAFVVEASGTRALSPSPAPGGDWQLTTAGRYLLSAVAFVAYAPEGTGFTFELGGGGFTGPTYLIAPRIEVQLVDALYAEVGAYLLGGRGTRDPGDPAVSLGAVYDDVDQVFVGLRWLP